MAVKLATTPRPGSTRVTVQYRQSGSCSRCGYQFHRYDERMIDRQMPRFQGDSIIVTNRCRDQKACQKRATKRDKAEIAAKKAQKTPLAVIMETTASAAE